VAEPKNMATDYYCVDDFVILLLKIWINKEDNEVDISDIFALPGYIELAKSSKILYDLVGRHVLSFVFGTSFQVEKGSAAWLFGLNSSFYSALKEIDTRTMATILKAIEILKTAPLSGGTACMPLPDMSAGHWCFQEGGVRLLYEVDEQNKRVHLLSLTQQA
jgi:mRNA-degrading endonuclease RelE of RelBE toxin-antitoxin system